MARRKVGNPLAFAVLGCLGERPMPCRRCDGATASR